jgi:hypothetical protein
MLVTENKRMEWNIPFGARVLPLTFLDYNAKRYVRSNLELKPHERRRIKLVAFCPMGREVRGDDRDCVRCKWWVKTMFCVVICRYPKRV